MITAAATAPKPAPTPTQFDVGITTGGHLGPLPVGKETDHLMAVPMPAGSSMTMSSTVTRNGHTESHSVTAGAGDFSLVGSHQAKTALIPHGGRSWDGAARQDSTAGAALTTIADTVTRSTLLHPFDATPAGEPREGAKDTVTFGYYDPRMAHRMEGTFVLDAVPAELQPAYDGARAIFERVRTSAMDDIPFDDPKPEPAPAKA
jgi:hypothetical protein